MARAFGKLVIRMLAILAIAFSVVPSLAQEGEKKVSIAQVPERVKAAILKEVKDGKLVDIGEFSDGDKKRYEIEMVLNGTEFDVLFSSNGKVVRRRFESLESEESETIKAADKCADEYQDSFDVEDRNFASSGRNKYFILEPGYQLILEGNQGGHTVKLEILVLDQTKNIGNVETRVVEERETVDGELTEVSRNYFAICKQTKSVFYFGEDVSMYQDGKIVSHEGAWIHGKNDARAGMMMPGEPVLGAAYYQEVAPRVAMDRAKLVDTSATLDTPAGKFTACLKVQEENPLDREIEFKTHAPGIGLIQDENLLLVKHGFVNK